MAAAAQRLDGSLERERAAAEQPANVVIEPAPLPSQLAPDVKVV